MISKELINTLGFTAPIISSLVSMVLVWKGVRETKNSSQRNLHYHMIATYLVAALCWFGLVLYIANEKIFIYYHTLFLLTLMLDQVLIYKFVFDITSSLKSEKFSCLHYIIPLLIVIVVGIFTLKTPFLEQYMAIYGEVKTNGAKTFKTIYSITYFTFIIYNIMYPLLGLLHIGRYRREVVDYSADTQRSSMNWLYVMLILTIITVPFPLSGLLTGTNAFTSLWFTLSGALPTFVVYLVICYNLLSNNYVTIEPDSPEESVKKNSIDKKKFERYMREKKPYLNPQLRINDLAADMHTNRTYLSTFINQEYGMNFNRFINIYRLNELDELLKSAAAKERTNMELLMMVGFNSYNSYIRVKTAENRLGILKEFE